MRIRAPKFPGPSIDSVIYEKIGILLREFFKDDEEWGPIVKSNLWMGIPNPLLGGLTPMQMLMANPKKLLKFVQNQLDENKRS